MTAILAVTAVALCAILGVVYLSRTITEIGRKQYESLEAIVKEQQKFIEKNIHERVIYSTPDAPYTTPSTSEDDEEIEESDDLVEISPEILSESRSQKK